MGRREKGENSEREGTEREEEKGTWDGWGERRVAREKEVQR